MNKRWPAVLLAALMTFSLDPFTVTALDGEPPGDVTSREEIIQESAGEISRMAAGEYLPIAGYTLPAGTDSVTTGATYGWTRNNNTDTLISGNAGVSSSVSTLRITVTGSGVLCFMYRVYSGTTDDETNPDSLMISVGTEVTTSTSYKSFTGLRYYGETGWQNGTVTLDAGEGETTDIYITYKKNGSVNCSLDCALIKDITFNSGRTTVTAATSDATYGSVSGAGSFYAGEIVTLTATPQPGGKLFGWVRDGLFIDSTETAYTFTAGADTSVTAVFGSATLTSAQNRATGAVYQDLAAALEAASTGDTVWLVGDTTLTRNATVPEGVTLYVPYKAAFDAAGNADGTTADSANGFAAGAKTFRHLTVDSGVTLTVCGELLVGGTIGYPSTSYQGHTSGSHGRITNNGSILVSGGQIDCYGFIDGTGLVEAVTGGVYEPFVVYDFAGGNNTDKLYSADQNPFIQYTTQNISCTLTLHAAATYGAYCNLYAGSQYNKTTAVLICAKTARPNAVLLLDAGATVTRVTDRAKSIPGGTTNDASSYGGDIYRTTYTVSGGAALGNMSMIIYGFDVSVSRMPVSYANAYVLTDGDYTMAKTWCVLPGGALTVASDATLTVTGGLLVLDGLINSGMSGRYYPSSARLSSAGFTTNGVLTVDGALTLETGSTFGGLIQTNGTGTVTVENGVTVKTAALQIGAPAYYDDNTCVMPLDGRLYIDGALTDIVPGTVYYGADGDTRTFEGYTVTEYASAQKSATQPASGKYTPYNNADGQVVGYTLYAGPETVVTNQSVVGGFSLQQIVGGDVTVTVSVGTCTDATDASKATVSEPVLSDGVIAFTVETAQNYVAYVEYAYEGGSETVLTPDGNGVYTVTDTGVDVTVTVTCVRLGDVNRDGYVDSTDSLKVLNYATGKEIPDTFAAIAADVNRDGYRDSTDSLLILNFATGKISNF